MADERDKRLRVDLPIPYDADVDLDAIRQALAPVFQNAVVIKEGESGEERGFIDLERCGHRFDLSCEKIARWEVGRGQVFPVE